MALKKVIEKYWYEDAFGRHFYSLEDDRSVRVVKLVDTKADHAFVAAL